jgi:hypothetical protein
LWLSSSPRCRCVMSNSRWQKCFDMHLSWVSVDGDDDAARTPPQGPPPQGFPPRLSRASQTSFNKSLLYVGFGASFVASRCAFSAAFFQGYRSLIDIPVLRRNWLMIPHSSCLRFALSGRTYSSACFLFFIQGRTPSHESTYTSLAEKLSCVRIREGSRTFSSSEIVRLLARRRCFSRI